MHTEQIIRLPPHCTGVKIATVSRWCRWAAVLWLDWLICSSIPLTTHASNMLFIWSTHFELIPVATISVSNLTLCSPDSVY